MLMAMRNLQQVVTKTHSVSTTCHMSRECITGSKCLKVLYPQFGFLFLFEHSCGHDRQKEDGLNVENINKEFGGAQWKLHNTTIKKQQGYLGPHSPILKPSNVQSIVFKSNDVRPFWMTPAE